MSSIQSPRHSGKFAIALLGKNSEFNNKIQHLIVSNGSGSVQALKDFVVLENNSFRLISSHDFFDEECPYPGQRIIDFMSHSYPGLHLFILAIDSENAQIDKIISHILTLQAVFGDNVTQHIVVMLDKLNSVTLLCQLKDMFRIELGTLSDHLADDCKRWCSVRPLFQHDYRHYSKGVVETRKNSLKMTRNEPRPRFPRDRPGVTKFDISETEVNMVLLGLTGTGKSASGNTILTAMNPQLEPKQLFESKPSSTPVTTKCQFTMLRLFGRQVRVVDTPDFFDDDTNSQAEVDECKKYCQPGRCVVLLVIQMGRFTEGEKGILERLEEKLGWKIRESTIVLLTHGENVKDQGQSFIAERFHLNYIVRACSNRFHVFKNTSKNTKQVMELFKKIPDYKEIFPEYTERHSLLECYLS